MEFMLFAFIFCCCYHSGVIHGAHTINFEINAWKQISTFTCVLFSYSILHMKNIKMIEKNTFFLNSLNNTKNSMELWQSLFMFHFCECFGNGSGNIASISIARSRIFHCTKSMKFKNALSKWKNKNKTKTKKMISYWSVKCSRTSKWFVTRRIVVQSMIIRK